MKKPNAFYALILSCTLVTAVYGQSNTDQAWSLVNEKNIKASGKRQIVPQKYLAVQLNGSLLKNVLFSAPNENAVKISESSSILSLPLPNGSFQKFRVVESPIMAGALAAAYPDFKTFSIKGIDDPTASGKLDWNTFGFHGMVRSVNGDFFIDPFCVGDIDNYITYYTSDFIKDPASANPEIGVAGNKKTNGSSQGSSGQNNNNTGSKTENTNPAVCVGDKLRTYRLVVTCTGEYAVAATGLTAPTVAQTLAKIITSVNRVDGVYETEVAVRMVLVPTETTVIFTNASSDPYTANNDGGTLLGQSQAEVTSVIGTPNFDIGHIFSTGGGGIAFLGCVCDSAFKAQGVTGSQSPVGDPYDIDYVAHEMGHQFGGNHPFNAITGSCGGGNRNASTAMEPGSGVTIMAYAGICGTNDLDPHSIAYFHAISYDEIVNFTNLAGGSSCPVLSNSGNQPPVVTGSGDYVIPKSTAFTLTGSATDPDNDQLTYSWEEMDLGPGNGDNWNSGNAPYFRSYTPTNSPTRSFPTASVVLSGNYTGTRGEYVPPTAQIMKFRLTARDNKMGGGGVCYAVSTVTVDNSGPLTVTYPNLGGVVWGSGTQQTVTWDVNGTDQAPVSCGIVRIMISMDGGSTYNVLLGTTPNDGTQIISTPTVASTINTCRIKVESFGSIFYDVGNSNFTIANTTGISQVSQNNALGLTVWPNPTSGQLNFSVGNLNSAGITSLSVVDVLGNIVLQSDYNNRNELKENIDLSSASKGVYFIKITNDNRQAVYRIVKD